ncbi:hypothetical protein [Providencia phage PSTRCR_127]|nr:hypothetical protein [Providencia phage PSTRCR_127]QQV88868.1 hypothetical protein [Providencia phage PSTRCR_121]UGO50300.1 putative anti-sigma 70 protein [Morganella phage vB_MmoM_Rgz1]
MLNTVREIINVASILIKFDCEDILENKPLFIEFINELGLRNNGKLFNKSNFAKLMSSLSDEEKATVIEEFNVGHKSVYRTLAMYSKD